jgi:hypothetical protein
MKFFSLAIVTVLIATVAGSPVDRTYKPDEFSATSTAFDSCKKPQGHMIFRSKLLNLVSHYGGSEQILMNIIGERWRIQGQDCVKGDRCVGTSCHFGKCRWVIKALGMKCIHGDVCLWSGCRNGYCSAKPKKSSVS